MALKNYKDDSGSKSNLPKLLIILGVLALLFVIIKFGLGW